MKVLYNDCYGGFNFSEAFLAAYKTRTGRALDPDRALFRVGPNSIRCDPDAIALVEQHGSEWASGPHAYIAIREFPDLFAHYWSIDEYDGSETVQISVSDVLADALDTFMATRDLATLERQYLAIQAARQMLWKTVPDTEPEDVKKASVEIADYGNYCGISAGCAGGASGQ